MPQATVLPRFQTPRSADWRPALQALLRTELLCALRVRCGMQDCPGDLGWVVLHSPMPELSDAWMFAYLAPRGFALAHDAENRPVAPPTYTRSQRQRAAHPHQQRTDWQGGLGAYELGGDTHGLDDGRPVRVRCDRCNGQRLMEFGLRETRQAIARALQRSVDSC